jgi:hypothetical protein
MADFYVEYPAQGGGGGGANTALSNLTTTSINTNLLPNASSTLTLGDSSLLWANLYTDNGNIGRLSVNTANNTFAFQSKANVDGVAMRLYGNSDIFRSDFAAGSFGLRINAYDDANGVYKDVQTDSENLILNTNTSAVVNVLGTAILNVQFSTITANADLSLNTHLITNVVDPINPQDAATKAYVDSLIPPVVISAAYHLPANGTYGPTAPIDFSTQEFDTNAAVTTGAAWKFTAPSQGLYLITGAINFITSAAGVKLYKNGSAYKHLGFDSTTMDGSYSGTVRLLAGDFIDIRPSASTTVGGGALSADSTSNINIVKIGNY